MRRKETCSGRHNLTVTAMFHSIIAAMSPPNVNSPTRAALDRALVAPRKSSTISPTPMTRLTGSKELFMRRLGLLDDSDFKREPLQRGFLLPTGFAIHYQQEFNGIWVSDRAA